MSDRDRLVFLKLGGSLITDKSTSHTPRPEVIARLAGEIRACLTRAAGLRLVLGHGSGSFGHVPAKKYGTRAGVHSPGEWDGFVEVWREARALNQLVMEALAAAGLPAIAMPPSAGVTTSAGKITSWDLAPLRSALSAGLVPVIYGDVIFDPSLGGTILSTEELFDYLAGQLHPNRILLAGIEAGVWENFPARDRLIAEITPGSFARIRAALGGSAQSDVTGGMVSKVSTMLDLVSREPGLEVFIFSGATPGLVENAMLGACPGTRIFGDPT